MNTSEQLASVLTPRSAALTLHSSSNPAIEQQAHRGDQLTPLTRMAGGFVEVEFADGRWFAAEAALEPWTLDAGAAGALPSGPFSFAPLRPPAPTPLADTQTAYPQDQYGYQQASPPQPATQPDAFGYQQPNPAPGYQQPPPQPAYQQQQPNYPQPYPQPGYQQPQSPVGYGGYAAAPSRPCFNCGREWGIGRACQFCLAVMGLPAGITVASTGRRFGGYLVEALLIIFTLIIGWFVWSLIVYGRGQTPAKQLLGMRVVDVNSGRAAGWGTMFLREVICKGIIGFIPFAYLWLLWDKDNQELWDKMLNTLVVNDPQMLLAPGR